MRHDESLMEILGRYADGAASAGEVERLNAALKLDSELRRIYLRYMNVDSALAFAARPISAPPVRRLIRPSRVAWIAGIAATVALMLVAVLWRAEKSSGVAAPFATLVGAQEAVWGDPNTELALNGGLLPTEAIRLESGVAEFLLLNGATVVLHGPGTLQFRSPKQVFVEEGRVFCRCPTPESRISVETPVTEVLDLGTEFTVESRPDRSACVAVLSGEVRVGTTQTKNLRKGEAAEVRADGILVVRMLTAGELEEMLRTAPLTGVSLKGGTNLLRDPGFDGGLNAESWSGTLSNLTADRLGRNGGGMRVSARGFAPWPQCRQKLDVGDISGKVVVASVWAATPSDNRLRSGQYAMLKIAFVNDQGREFGFVKRHILGSQSPVGHYEAAQLAAIAPKGTRGLQFQLVLGTNAHQAGAVVFDDASLMIADTPGH